MLNTKDNSKIQPVEQDFYNEKNNFDGEQTEADILTFGKKPTRKFKVIDDSLIDAGIKKGQLLKWREDFEPLKDEGCLFIVSLSGGDMVARFVRIINDDEFILCAANEQISDLVACAEETDVIGIVVPKIKMPAREYSKNPLEENIDDLADDDWENDALFPSYYFG